MRTLNPEQFASLTQRVTEPRYLVQITLDRTYYCSSHGDVVWKGQTWSGNDLVVGQVSPERCSLKVGNSDYRHTAAAMSGAYQRQPVQVWWAYQHAPQAYAEAGYWADDYAEGQTITPILLFDGLVSSCPSIGLQMDIEAETQPPRQFPSTRIRAPLANHLPPVGFTLTWGGEVYRIETRKNG